MRGLLALHHSHGASLGYVAKHCGFRPKYDKLIELAAIGDDAPVVSLEPEIEAACGCQTKIGGDDAARR